MSTIFCDIGRKIIICGKRSGQYGDKERRMAWRMATEFVKRQNKAAKVAILCQKECEKRRRKGAKAIIESNCGLILQNAVEFVVCRS